jgi:hypothetical protein
MACKIVVFPEALSPRRRLTFGSFGLGKSFRRLGSSLDGDRKSVSGWMKEIIEWSKVRMLPRSSISRYISIILSNCYAANLRGLSTNPISRKSAKASRKNLNTFFHASNLTFCFPSLCVLFFAALREILRLCGLKTRNVSRKAAKPQKNHAKISIRFFILPTGLFCFPSLCVFSSLRLCVGFFDCRG